MKIIYGTFETEKIVYFINNQSLLPKLSVKLDYSFCQNMNPYFFPYKFQKQFLVKWDMPNNNNLLLFRYLKEFPVLTNH